MKTLLIDDEPRARQELRRLLGSHPDIEVVGEAEDVSSGIAAVETLRPDLLFLDVLMPDGSGFDLLQQLEATPAVIFCTAFNQHVVQAFEVDALDYLLKPVEPARLAVALDRVRPTLAPTITQKNNFPAPLRSHERIFVREGDRCWFVALGNVHAFESIGNYSKLHLDKAQPLILRSLNTLELRLDPAVFFRASRNTIINLESISAVEPWFGGSLKVTLRTGLSVELSRRQSALFRDLRSW